jgi:hypothetical protein
MTDEERKLLVEVAMGVGVLFEKLANGASIHELGAACDTYSSRVGDLAMRVHRSQDNGGTDRG